MIFVYVSPNAPPGSSRKEKRKSLHVRSCEMSEEDMIKNSQPYSYLQFPD